MASNIFMRRVIFGLAGKVKATAVEVNDISGKTAILSVEENGGEIVLACGSIGTPHCLMLSGIGPKDELKLHNIPLITNIEGVGKNLMDHGVCQVIVRYVLYHLDFTKLRYSII